MSNDGVCAIVTGSASGLGAATALKLARQDARLVINYASSAKEAEETADLCRAAGAEVVVTPNWLLRGEYRYSSYGGYHATLGRSRSSRM